MHTLVYRFTLQCWEDEFQVTLISLELITRASPQGTGGDVHLNEWLSSLYLPSPSSAKNLIGRLENIWTTIPAWATRQ